MSQTMSDAQLDALLRGAASTASTDASACVDTPEMDLGRLLALAGGPAATDDAAPPADPEALAHLARCTFCRALLRDALEPASDLLVARLDRAFSTGQAPARAAAPIKTPLRRFAYAAAAVAMAAGLLIALQGPRPEAGAPVPAYTLEGLHGGLVEVRAERQDSGVFLPESRVELVLRPEKARTAGAGEAPIVGLFRVEADGRLLRLVEGVKADVQPNGAVLLTATGRAAFGEAAGPKRLLAVLAPTPAALDALSGAELEAARADTALRTFQVQAVYQLAP